MKMLVFADANDQPVRVPLADAADPPSISSLADAFERDRANAGARLLFSYPLMVYLLNLQAK
jgi:hypothetical protein